MSIENDGNNGLEKTILAVMVILFLLYQVADTGFFVVVCGAVVAVAPIVAGLFMIFGKRRR